METIYDHPLYYDILFGWDRSREAEFYHLVFERCGVAPEERVLEFACGTGQVARRLARRGWEVTGLDVRPEMLAFLEQAAASEQVHVETLCADMTTFQTATKFAAAYNPMSSFRLLHSDAEAEAHLLCVAGTLRSGGVYVLDMTFLSKHDEPAITTDESWTMTRGKVKVCAEEAGLHVTDGATELALAWGEEGHLRGYTTRDFTRRVEAVSALQIESWHAESRGSEGISEFDASEAAPGPVPGRTMVVLRRS